MDDPSANRAELAEALRFIRAINARLGGVGALRRRLDAWSRHWPKDRPITLLDVATGSADIPLACARWAERSGFDLRITAIDRHPTTLDLAREHLCGKPSAARIELVECDALKLMDRFAAGSFDYVHAGMFLHHLPEIEALTALRIMDRIARAGLVWNDLIRSRAGVFAIRLLTIGRAAMVRHDARVSVEAGFTPSEVLDAARRLNLSYTRLRWSLFTHRFTLAGEKPGAWSDAIISHEIKSEPALIDKKRRS